MKKLDFSAYINWLKHPKARKWILLSFSALIFSTFLIVTSEVLEASAGAPELISDLDQKVITAVTSLRTPKLNGIAVDITALGSTTVLILLVSIFSLLLFFQRKNLSAFLLLVTSIGAALLSLLGKVYFERHRPEEALRLVAVDGYSYPSGHSLAGAAVYFSIALLICRIYKNSFHRSIIFSFFSILTLLIGLSRVYLGVHYLSDIMAGILLGIAWASFMGSIFLFLETRRKKYVAS